ncbi:9318_t:CDS:2 [Ambispora gerdemannii]|uniref:9318_t:CDS:1 n=1 Tax=Ambispora gerdemannii TaxID=144530 RepID=A0A9N9CIL6_9GLOM|nr:9318_t:CDS:2 [Ambispora gerdemannii]
MSNPIIESQNLNNVNNKDTTRGFYSTSQMAHDTFDLLNHLGWTTKVHLVGISMGGMIAQEMSYAKPEYFQSLCLTSTHAGSFPPIVGALTILKMMFIRDRQKKIPIFVDLIFPKPWLTSPAPSNSSYATNNEYLYDLLRQRIMITKSATLTGTVGQIVAILTHRVSRERLLHIRENIPRILVNTGTWDNLVKPKNSYFLKDQLNADFHVFEGSGHGLPTEQAERYNAGLEDHFRKAGFVVAGSTNRSIL